MLIIALLPAAADTGAAMPSTSRSACGADSLYARVPVYVRVTIANRTDTAAAASLLLIGQAVATRVRAALGAAPDSVPRGDTLAFVPRRDSVRSAVWGNDLDSAGVHVVARRDGTLRWSLIQNAASPAAVLLERALADAKASDETFIPPDNFGADSLPFTLNYVRGYQIAGGRVVARAAGPPTLVAYTTRMGVEKQAGAVPGTLRPRYPDGALYGRAEGYVVLQFVVDTTGVAVDSTIHDLWPKSKPRLTGALGEHYDRFVRAATESVRLAKFYPAEIAGCKVKQLVQLPVTYSLRR